MPPSCSMRDLTDDDKSAINEELDRSERVLKLAIEDMEQDGTYSDARAAEAARHVNDDVAERLSSRLDIPDDEVREALQSGSWE